MQDADLFMELAAIAGVFVGFGALIAVRSGGASDAHELAYIRSITVCQRESGRQARKAARSSSF